MYNNCRHIAFEMLNMFSIINQIILIVRALMANFGEILWTKAPNRPQGIMLQIFIIILFRISSKIVSLYSLLFPKSTDYSHYSQLYCHILQLFFTFAIKCAAILCSGLYYIKCICNSLLQ